MSLHYIYSNASNTTQDITAYCRLYQYSATTDAKEGSVAPSTLVVDDPDGILDFVGHRRLYTYEDLAAASNRVIHNGFIFGQKVSRGPYRNGAGRIWTLDLVDQNTLLNRRLMNGTDANRSAETDVTRLEALLGRGGFTQMTELNTVDDSLYFSGVSPVSMDAVDYRTQPCGTGYVDDCAQASGKNYFVWYREATGDYSLWYDFASSSNWSSTKRLSNVFADVDDTTTFAVDLEHESELDRDPSRVASGILLPFDGVATGTDTVSGTVYVQDAGTTATFAAIDWLAPSVNVKTQAKATARANRYLVDASTQDDLIHASVKLPAANVNDFLAGQRIEAKFSHLPGYEDFSWMRCLSRTVTEISEDPTRAYRLDLELSPQVQPGGDAYLVSFLAQRSGSTTGDGVQPRGWAVCNTDSPLTSWTWLAGASARGAGNYPLDVAYRAPAPSGEPLINSWGGPTGLNGTARPVGYSLQIAGATGPPVVLGSLSGSASVRTSWVSPTVTVPEAGWLFMFLSESSGVAPADAGGSYTFNPTTGGVVTVDQDYAFASFSPRSGLFYLPVSAGSASITIGYSGSNPFIYYFDGWGCVMTFIPGTALSIVDAVKATAAGSSLCWTWSVAP